MENGTRGNTGNPHPSFVPFSARPTLPRLVHDLQISVQSNYNSRRSSLRIQQLLIHRAPLIETPRETSAIRALKFSGARCEAAVSAGYRPSRFIHCDGRFNTARGSFKNRFPFELCNFHYLYLIFKHVVDANANANRSYVNINTSDFSSENSGAS